ncbi:MAG: type III pantothenate kinase, partial [Firmicutes bacterium]|nr:type III pantothenate kinase [Bacillota bacterium]
LFGCDTLVIGSGIKTGLKILTNNPALLGADLVVDAVAGIAEYGAPLIIIDMGTATTISVINGEGAYIGTVIMPGVTVSLNSLVSGTSQLPKISLEKPKTIIGTNTADCMKSGIMYGTAASIDGMIDKIRRELGADARAVATGGVAPVIIPRCEREIPVDDE